MRSLGSNHTRQDPDPELPASTCVLAIAGLSALSWAALIELGLVCWSLVLLV